MFLYKTSPALLGEVPGIGREAAAALVRAGVEPGMLFVLGPDGAYDVALNRFLRELPDWGVRAANSQAAYARDLTLFCRFLHQRRGGRTIWQVVQEDLRAFKMVRRRVGVEQGRITAGTWNRFIAALDKWVEWAIHEDLLLERPFRRVERTVMTDRGLVRVLVNAERDRDDDSEPIKFLPYEDYVVWRDVGLRGQLPDGRPDSHWRGRHGERNALFADLLVGTGMRLTEGSSLLVSEIPPLAEREATGRLRLSPTITKRSKARTVYISRRVLRSLHHYLDIERDELVSRRTAAGAYREERWIPVTAWGRTGTTRAGAARVTAHRLLSTAERRRLLAVDVQGDPKAPLWLWLGDDGLPLALSTWQAVFRRANQRCASFGLELEASPHTLRHTFAVHMLGLLLRQTVRALRATPGETLLSQQVKRLLIGDPLRKLQLLMGHSSRDTTLLYLDVLDEAQEIVLESLHEWDRQAEHLAMLAQIRPDEMPEAAA